jgi:ABC-type multidrug transport system fused ATPase/permease subunit
MGQFYGPIGGLVRVYDIFYRALAALARLFHILDEKPEIQDAPDAVALTQVRGAVDLENVSFRYKTGEMVLKDLTVHADPGETIALVGRSGAGKTSLVNLIPRFYDPSAGRVLVDGRDVRTVTQASLRRHLALVLQETFLFDGTVRENLAYGRLEASDEQIHAAAQAAYAEEFILDLPDAYDTRIGERGVKLSGGQRQRLAIARALLADPAILILDEATSLVDTEAEQKIQAALDNLRKGRTVFVIAHRLSTVRNANKILVLEGGEIVEEDTHTALMAKNGLYAEMYQRQFQLGMWEDQGFPSDPDA